MPQENINHSIPITLDFNLLMINGGMKPTRIKKIRTKYGMRQTEFANLLGVIYTTYSSWERGVRKPSSPSCALLQIAEKYPAIFLQNRKDIIKHIMLYFSKSHSLSK